MILQCLTTITRFSVIRAVITILLLFTFTSMVILSIWIDSGKWPKWRSHFLYSSSPDAFYSGQKNDPQTGRRRRNNFAKSNHWSSSYFTDLNFFTWSARERPWFLDNGTLGPDPQDSSFSRLVLFPDQDSSESDTIINQLMYIPYNYEPERLVQEKKLKKILLYFDRASWGGQGLKPGRTIFTNDNCPVDTCSLTFDTKEETTADAILFKDHFLKPKHQKPFNQVWILYLLECPLHTQPFRGLNNLINWTATYRHDSDIVTPYEKFVLYDPEIKAQTQSINYAKGKTKQVAWFVSNCAARNKRYEYARELSKYISVDIYGGCGKNRCPRKQAEECFDKLEREYKFYLAFENSNCRDYITEKFFYNGLSRNIIPIAMGAHPDDYKRSAPFNSYLHVNDFESPKHLAEYLKKLDANDTLYNQFFEWKGTGQFINTHFWCRLCAMLHQEPMKEKSYDNLASWWYSPSICNSDGWF